MRTCRYAHWHVKLITTHCISCLEKMENDSTSTSTMSVALKVTDQEGKQNPLLQKEMTAPGITASVSSHGIPDTIPSWKAAVVSFLNENFPIHHLPYLICLLHSLTSIWSPLTGVGRGFLHSNSWGARPIAEAYLVYIQLPKKLQEKRWPLHSEDPCYRKKHSYRPELTAIPSIHCNTQPSSKPNPNAEKVDFLWTGCRSYMWDFLIFGKKGSFFMAMSTEAPSPQLVWWQNDGNLSEDSGPWRNDD